MKVGNGYSINFYKKVDGIGWVFNSLRITDDTTRLQLKELLRQRRAGTVRALEAVKLYEAKVG